MRVLLVPSLAATLLLLAGCSGDKAEISGTVRLDGQLIEEGSINFIPIEGTTGPGAGAVIAKGRYHIPQSKGATVGKNRVELRAFKMTGRKVIDPTGRPGAVTQERVPAFPPEYNDNSKLVEEIHKGSNTLDFDISAPKPVKGSRGS
jgi:hypothetical protein